ncbi:MAG: FAD-dependent thymidylate synthase [Candidatus Sumerlaeia bacterium]
MQTCPDIRTQPWLEERRLLDKGFVRLLDCLASDQNVIDAARVSTGSQSDPERDRKLIHFLMKHHHETPFEHLVFRFHVRCPLFVARQWMRHRIASYNEASGRYRVFADEYYVPDLDDLPPGFFDDADIQKYCDAMEHTYAVYRELLDKVKDHKQHRSRAREVFRGLLGTAYYTEFYFTVNFRSLMNFINLRSSPEAQYEIRVYAEAIRDMVRPRIPLCFEAYELFILDNGKRQ